MQKDIDFLSREISWSALKIESCDSILALSASQFEAWDPAVFYGNMNHVNQSIPFFPTQGTYEQIVTSGMLKSFDQEMANKMNAYHMQLNKISYWAHIEDETLWILADLIWNGLNVRAM